MVIQRMDNKDAEEFMKHLTCPECGKRTIFNGSGQAGIHRVVCYYCSDCDIIYQLITEKKGVPMFDELKEEGRCVLVPDKDQNKCNLCACGLYPDL